MTRRLRLPLLAAAALLGAPAAPANPNDFQDANAVRFDNLEDELNLNLSGRSVGYGYAVYHNETFARGGGGGSRRIARVNRPSLPFTAYTRKGCHSMSKAITAAAMLRALQMRGLSVDSPIYPHLPKMLQAAVQDDDVKTITFRQILAHRSGIPEGGWSWNSLLQGAATVNPSIGTFDYANWNYAVCRTLIPFVLLPQQMRSIEWFWFVDINSYCANVYTNFVQSQVLFPAGVPNASWRSPDDIDSTNFSYYYNFGNLAVEEEMPNRFTTIGSGGWAMSANGYARFMARLQSGSLLTGHLLTGNGPEPVLEVMRDSELGMFDSFGQRFYDHSGANTYTNDQNQDYGGRSQWVHDTDTNLTVCVQVNSVGSFASGELYAIITNAIRNAFDAATTTSAPIPPQDMEKHYVIESAQLVPLPAPAPPQFRLREPLRLGVAHHTGRLQLSFPSVPEMVHVIEQLEDGLWVPVEALPGDGSTLTHTPATRVGTALFRVTTLPVSGTPEPQ